MDETLIERHIAQRTAEVERAIDHAILAALDVDAPYEGIDGHVRTRVHRAEVALLLHAGARCGRASIDVPRVR